MEKKKITLPEQCSTFFDMKGQLFDALKATFIFSKQGAVCSFLLPLLVHSFFLVRATQKSEAL